MDSDSDPYVHMDSYMHSEHTNLCVKVTFLSVKGVYDSKNFPYPIGIKFSRTIFPIKRVHIDNVQAHKFSFIERAETDVDGR